MRLFVLYGMGGFGVSLAPWYKAAPDWIEVRVIELPGHGWRASEPLPFAPGSDSDPSLFVSTPLASEAVARDEPQTSEGNGRTHSSVDADTPGTRLTTAALAAARSVIICHLVDAIAPFTDQPYAIYGFSNGAQIGYLMTLEIEARGLPPPRRLFCACRGAPHILRYSAQQLLRFFGMSDDETIAWAEDAGVLAPAAERHGIKVNPRFGVVSRAGVIGMLSVGETGDAHQVLRPRTGASQAGLAHPGTAHDEARGKAEPLVPATVAAPAEAPAVGCLNVLNESYAPSSSVPVLRASPLVALLGHDDAMWSATKYMGAWAEVATAGFRAVAIGGAAHHELQSHQAMQREVYGELVDMLASASSSTQLPQLSVALLSALPPPPPTITAEETGDGDMEGPLAAFLKTAGLTHLAEALAGLDLEAAKSALAADKAAFVASLRERGMRPSGAAAFAAKLAKA